jgi:RNA polymerase sigma factor (sigma-70 family)
MSDNGLKACFLNERPSLLRFLRARLSNPDEAEDVLQDVWLKLEEKASGPVAQPGAYLFRMANNVATDRHRSAIQRARREEDWGGVNPPSTATPSVEWAMIQSERLAIIDARIDALPERTRQIFRLYRYDGVARRAIAETLGVSISAIEKHLGRAYRAIHGLSDQDVEAERPGRGAFLSSDGP